MGKILSSIAGAWRRSKTRQTLRPSSPELPGTITKIGRFLYGASAGWIVTVWYTAYVNMRTQPGSGPKFLLPGSGKPVIATPDRAGRTPSFITESANQPVASAGPGSTSGKSGPFPGASGSRLDQGFDLTGTVFQAPDKSKIIYASANVAGWRGGGLVAGLLLQGPKKGMVWYMAEGLKPKVSLGQVVEADEEVADPAPNPYNKIMGNIEAGWANPHNPTQPLAQIHTNPPSVTWDWYNYQRSLGGPIAAQTGNAGYP